MFFLRAPVRVRGVYGSMEIKSDEVDCDVRQLRRTGKLEEIVTSLATDGFHFRQFDVFNSFSRHLSTQNHVLKPCVWNAWNWSLRPSHEKHSRNLLLCLKDIFKRYKQDIRPPTFVEQARYWANYHENGVFSDEDINGIGTPFISFFQQTGVIGEHPGLAGIPDYASAIAIELRRGSAPDVRDFLRVKFKNGSASNFEDVHVFGHHADVPLTESIYRAENAAIISNKQWMEVCGAKPSVDILGMNAGPDSIFFYSIFFYVMACIALAGVIFTSVQFIKYRRLKLQGEELSQVVYADYASITRAAKASEEGVHGTADIQLSSRAVDLPVTVADVTLSWFIRF
ncbi:hypothetical protein BDZ97DRAFT_2077399 [Flammula alnicola]|nr:hypothetical protein BDZ97DRAFT_2077399 [Flammula alnicola]